MRFLVIAQSVVLGAVSLIAPLAVYAQTSTNTAITTLVNNLVINIIQPIILVLFAVAFLLFVNGVAVYMLNANNPKERAKGTQHILWGVIGFFIMTSVMLILRVLVGTFGITDLPSGTL